MRLSGAGSAKKEERRKGAFRIAVDRADRTNGFLDPLVPDEVLEGELGDRAQRKDQLIHGVHSMTDTANDQSLIREQKT